jgi:RNA polymerase sigma-70 factor (sigma-E family)
MSRHDEEFTAFVSARYATLVRSAVLLGCPTPDAEDATQAALARCYAAWSRVRRADDPDAYVYRVLVNGLSRGWRRRWRGEVPHADLPEPAGPDRVATGGDPAVVVDTRADVRAALARLSVEHRRVLVLRYFADFTERQVSAVLDVPLGTVKSRTARAVAALAAELAGTGRRDSRAPGGTES